MPTSITYSTLPLRAKNGHNRIDGKSFQQFECGGTRMVAFRQIDQSGSLVDVVDFSPPTPEGSFFNCQVSTINIPRGFRRVNNLKDLDPGEFKPNLATVTGQNTCATLTLLDRVHPAPAGGGRASVMNNNFHPSSLSKGSINAGGKRTAKGWGTINPCGLKLAGGEPGQKLVLGELNPAINQRYITVLWDWRTGYAGNRFQRIHDMLEAKFGNYSYPLPMIGCIIPNRTIVWVPQPFLEADRATRHNYLWGHSRDRMYALYDLEFLDGPNIFVSFDFNPVVAPL